MEIIENGKKMLSPELSLHSGFSRIFQPDRLTFGFVAPLEGYSQGPLPTNSGHREIIQKADKSGISALWLRDVPFLDPNFGDAGQVYDAMAYAGWLAAVTKNMTIGTAGIVAPLRDPLIVAKQATTIDRLTNGRFVLGLASGDRYLEYPAFGVYYEQKAERYQEARAIIAKVTENSFPRYRSKYYGQLDGSLDLIPKPFHTKIPTLAIGRAGQNLEWIAENMDGWIWHGSDAASMTDILPAWRAANGQNSFKPFGYGTWFDLSEDPEEPLHRGRILRAGRKALIDLFRSQQDAGVSHVILNLKQTLRPATEILDELAEYIIPLFPSHH
jgi:luciferase-type oxidoreductase